MIVYLVTGVDNTWFDRWRARNAGGYWFPPLGAYVFDKRITAQYFGSINRAGIFEYALNYKSEIPWMPED